MKQARKKIKKSVEQKWGNFFSFSPISLCTDICILKIEEIGAIMVGNWRWTTKWSYDVEIFSTLWWCAKNIRPLYGAKLNFHPTAPFAEEWKCMKRRRNNRLKLLKGKTPYMLSSDNWKFFQPSSLRYTISGW